MDVQAQDSGVHPGSAAAHTASVPRAITFRDPIYTDTAPTPVVGHRPQERNRSERNRSERNRSDSAGVRLIRAAIVIAIVALLGCAAVLGLVKAGVINPSGAKAGSGSPGTHNAAVPRTPLAVPTASGAQTASYAVDAGAFVLTIATGPGAAWVSVGLVGQHPVFAGIINPHTSKGFTVLGSSQVEVGAGGTTLTLMSGHRTATLVPPVAPFTYQLATHQTQTRA
jgi:hypothetical protein